MAAYADHPHFFEAKGLEGSDTPHVRVARRVVIDGVGLDRLCVIFFGVVDGSLDEVGGDPLASVADLDEEAADRPDIFVVGSIRDVSFTAEVFVGFERRDRAPCDGFVAVVSEDADRSVCGYGLVQGLFFGGRTGASKGGWYGSENHAPAVFRTTARFEESLEVWPAVRSDGEEFHLGRRSLATLASAAPYRKMRLAMYAQSIRTTTEVMDPYMWVR